MTREEAIRIFRKEIECLSHTKCEDCILEKACDPMNTTPYDSEYIEAYSMAIEALEQEPTTKNDLGVDCISRQATINAVKRIHPVDTDYDCTLYDKVDVMYVLNDLPSVTPQEPQSFKWCTDCKEYDQEKHCCHRWSKAIRDTVEEMKQEPKTGHCKDCKWWKDSDGAYRRGIGAESQCPINSKEVFEGNGYCYMFEPQESEG